MKESRKYQIDAENNIPLFLKNHGSVIYQAPTGSGKSHVINSVTKRILRAGKIPLVLSDSDKIHKQLIKECDGIRIDSSVKYMEILNNHCYIAMAQSLKNRHEIMKKFHDLGDKLVVIVDECHRNTSTPAIYEINPCWLIGFSATPHYKWAKHLPELYNSLIPGPQIKILVKDKWLCHHKHIIRTTAALNELEIKGNDFSEESQERVFGTREMYDGIFEDLPLFHKNKTVIYVASIKQCEDMYSKLLEKGYKVCRYHSKLNDSENDLKKFTHLHTCDICVSVSSLTLGWDFPPIDLVIYWRSTTSLPLYLQIGGRGSRLCSSKDAEKFWGLKNYPNKEYFTLLDYGGNYERFGAWDMNRDWESLWLDPKKKRKISTYDGVAGSKICPTCQALLPTTSRSCYNCGYLYPEAEMKLIEGKLIEVENSIRALNNKLVSDLDPRELFNYGKYYDKRQYAIRVAMRQEQDKPGFLKEFAQAAGYKKTWLNKALERLPNEKIIFYNQIIR
jgi:superfamily II DNA or RNA helicase